MTQRGLLGKYLIAGFLACLLASNSQGSTTRIVRTRPVLDRVSGVPVSAYSLRKLKRSYTGYAINVRNSGGGAQDIGFTSGGNLDVATLNTFLGSNSGFVTTWYDQTGSVNLVQATTANQPRISNAGVVDTLNGRPLLTWQGTTQFMTGASSARTTINAVANFTTSSGYHTLVASTQNGDFSLRTAGAYPSPKCFNDGGSCSPNSNDWINGNAAAIWITGTQTATITNTPFSITANANSVITDTLSLSSSFMSRGLANGDGVFELVMYAAPITTNDRQILETDQKAFYSLH